jgi:hypothetical protein
MHLPEEKRTLYSLIKEEMKNCVWLKRERVAQIDFASFRQRPVSGFRIVLLYDLLRQLVFHLLVAISQVWGIRRLMIDGPRCKRRSIRLMLVLPTSGQSLLLKSLILKFQRPGVFRHRPHHIVRCAIGDFGFDFECHLDVRPHKA